MILCCFSVKMNPAFRIRGSWNALGSKLARGLVSVKEKKERGGLDRWRQALHSAGAGMKINLFVAVTIYKFCRAVLYAQLNPEVTWVLKEMEVHLIRVNEPCWVSCDTSLRCEDTLCEAEDLLSKVSVVWFFAETVSAWIQTYLHFVFYSVCFFLVVTVTFCICFFLCCFVPLRLLEQCAGEIRGLCLFPHVYGAVWLVLLACFPGQLSSTVCRSKLCKHMLMLQLAFGAVRLYNCALYFVTMELFNN